MKALLIIFISFSANAYADQYSKDIEGEFNPTFSSLHLQCRKGLLTVCNAVNINKDYAKFENEFKIVNDTLKEMERSYNAPRVILVKTRF